MFNALLILMSKSGDLDDFLAGMSSWNAPGGGGGWWLGGGGGGVATGADRGARGACRADRGARNACRATAV